MPTKTGGLTATEAGGAVINGLLEAERDMRQMAEQAVQDLRGALRLAAYTFAGEAFEGEIRHDQMAVEQWSADQWIAFFQEAAPVGQGWNDAKVLSQRLTEMTAERDALQGKVATLGAKAALMAEQLEAIKTAQAQAPPPIEVARDRLPEEGPLVGKGGGSSFQWPKVPARAPARYAREIGRGTWARIGTALGLIASGVSLRVEGQERLAQRFGKKPSDGAIKKVFVKLEEAGILEGECVRVHRSLTKFLWLSRLGQQISEACKFDLRETDFQRMLRLHGGANQKKHAAEVAAFAYHARRRRWNVEVMPQVEGEAKPDVVVFRGGNLIYVEVETSKNNRAAKWRNQTELQGFVAVCTVTRDQQERIVGEIKDLGLPGRATCLEALIQDKEGAKNLWAEAWSA